MRDKTLLAYTPPELAAAGIVPFINISRQADGDVKVLIRESNGRITSFLVPQAEWAKLEA